MTVSKASATKLIIQENRMKQTCLVLLAITVAASGEAPDLRGIWKAQTSANMNVEGSALVDPPGGTIPYQRSALAQRQKNLANRATADPETKCFQAGVPRATYLPYPFQVFQNTRGVYIVYQRAH